MDVNFQQVGGNSALAQLWGRSRIRDLMNQMYGRENSQGVEAVTKTAFDYNLLSRYTAFVAVDEKVPVEQDDDNTSKLTSQESQFIASSPIAFAPSNTQNNNSQSVPEPSEIIGNLLALMLVILFFTRKRWNHLLKALLQKWGSNASNN